MPEQIVIVEKEYRKGAAVFQGSGAFTFITAPPDEAALAKAILHTGARVAIVGNNAYTGPLYRALRETGGSGGGLIARFGVGHENVDKALAREHGCLVVNTPGALDQSVAEHTLWLMGGLAKQIAALDARLRAGDWAPATGMELRGKRLGLIGFGRIAQRVAAIAHFGFGMIVRAVGTRHRDEDLRASGIAGYTTDPAAVLANSDFVSLHLPGSPANRHFLDADRLAAMPRQAMLINTARGAVIDEAALYDALAARRLAGAALDVFQHEPYEPIAPGKDLRTLPNVLLTPHTGSNTTEANRAIAEACLINLQHFFRGEYDLLPQVS